MSAMTAAAERGIPRRWTLRWMLGATRYAFIRIRTRLLLEAPIERLRDVPAPAIPVRYRFGDAQDVERLDAIDPEYDAPAKREARHCLERGDRLVLGELDGRPIFCLWIMPGAITTGGRRITPTAPRYAYSYKMHTAAPYRGRGVASGAYHFLAPLLTSTGCRQVVCWISDRNAASLRVHERTGFSVVGRHYEVRLLGCWTTYWWSRGLARHLKRATS